MVIGQFGVVFKSQKTQSKAIHFDFIDKKLKLNIHKKSFGIMLKMIFVSPTIQQKAIEKFSIPPRKTTFIPNYVNMSEFSLSKSSNSEHTIGMLGSVPRLKRLDRALDILKIVRSEEPRFNLRIKGKLPNDYPWMLIEIRRRNELVSGAVR